MNFQDFESKSRFVLLGDRASVVMKAAVNVPRYVSRDETYYFGGLQKNPTSMLLECAERIMSRIR